MGMNHIFQLHINEQSRQVEFLKFSLCPQYSRLLEIDYKNQKCRILCYKEGKGEYIEIEKMIEPDFPDLIKLKEKIELYVIFS